VGSSQDGGEVRAVGGGIRARAAYRAMHWQANSTQRRQW
jgi:hypothetical protein